MCMYFFLHVFSIFSISIASLSRGDVNCLSSMRELYHLSVQAGKTEATLRYISIWVS